MKLKMKSALLSSAALAVALATTPASAGDMDPIYKALAEAKPLANLRLRYETADQDGKPKDAEALSLRGRFGLQTAPVYDFALLAEVETTSDWQDDYNDTFNGKTMYPVIADPADTQINRLQLTYTGFDNTKVTLGRQRIILDNARFVGNVGWRQNEQTFDAVRVQNTSIENVTIDVAYLEEVLRIFGSDSPMGQFDSNSWLANAKVNVPVEGAKLSLTGFAYLLDFENAKAASSKTYGANLHYARDNFVIKASYAAQSDYADQPTNYDADYYFAEGTYKMKPLILAAGYEVLTGDGTIGFATPLATAHAFNGFADVFLATPKDGLKDKYAKAVYLLPPIGPFDGGKLVGFYHDYEAENGGMDYGTEYDLVAVLKKGPCAFTAKYASYNADGYGKDIDRFSIQIDFDLGKVK